MDWTSVVIQALETLATAAAALGGAWWGAERSRRAAFDLYERERKEQMAAKDIELRNIRSLLRLELDHNLALVDGLRNQVMSGRNSDDVEFEARARFIELLMPLWGRMMYESLASRLPEAMSVDAVRQVYKKYADLERLTALHDDLSKSVPRNLIGDFEALMAFHQAELRLGRKQNIQSWARHKELMTFKEDSDGLWKECVECFSRLQQGNPVPSPL